MNVFPHKIKISPWQRLHCYITSAGCYASSHSDEVVVFCSQWSTGGNAGAAGQRDTGIFRLRHHTPGADCAESGPEHLASEDWSGWALGGPSESALHKYCNRWDSRLQAKGTVHVSVMDLTFTALTD